MKSHLSIALQSIKCFTDDGTLDENEVNYLLGIATADQHIDDDEKRVLKNIFKRAKESACSESTVRHIKEVEKKHLFM